MKGVSFSVEFVVAIVLVAVITVLALSLLSPVAGFDIKNFFNLNFPGGEPGEYHEGESNNPLTPPENVKITSEGYNFFTPSEVACYISNYIYNDMVKYGDDHNSRLNDEVFCYKTQLDERCIIGFGEGLISPISNEDFTKLTAESCRKCTDNTNQLLPNTVDEQCINYDFALKKVGQLPFCGNWYSDMGKEVTFFNSGCFKNPNNHWQGSDSQCSSYCWSGGPEWYKDRLTEWIGDTNPLPVNAVGIKAQYGDLSSLVHGRSSYSATGYFWFVSVRRAATAGANWGDACWSFNNFNAPPSDVSKYRVHFLKRAPAVEFSGDNLTWINDYFPDSPIRWNDLGIQYLPAREVVNVNFTLTQPITIPDLERIWTRGSVSGVYVPYSCSSKADCEYTEYKTWTTSTSNDLNPIGCYASDFTFSTDEHNKYPFAGDSKITFNYGGDINTPLKPGKYKVIVRNWFDHFMWHWADYALTDYVDFGVLYDRSIIIYNATDPNFQ